MSKLPEPAPWEGVKPTKKPAVSGILKTRGVKETLEG